jgi:hypothetical protein
MRSMHPDIPILATSAIPSQILEIAEYFGTWAVLRKPITSAWVSAIGSVTKCPPGVKQALGSPPDRTGIRCTNADRGRELLGEYLRSQLATRYVNKVCITDADPIWLQAMGIPASYGSSGLNYP